MRTVNGDHSCYHVETAIMRVSEMFVKRESELCVWRWLEEGCRCPKRPLYRWKTLRIRAFVLTYEDKISRWHHFVNS